MSQQKIEAQYATHKWIPIVIGCLLWIGIPFYGWYAYGWSGLEKTLTAFAMPMGLIWNVLVLGMLVTWFSGNRRACMVWFGLVVMLGLLGNELLGNALCWLVEPAAGQTSIDDSQKFFAVVLLGGSTRMSPAGVPELGVDGQRLLYAAQLYHTGQTPQIIATGGHPFGPESMTVARQATQLLTSIGVPRERTIELGGINTRTEIKALAQYFEDNPLASDQQVGLITNAAHIPRAMRLARREGLDFTPLPCAHYGQAWSFEPVRIIPTDRGIFTTTTACYEILARISGQ